MINKIKKSVATVLASFTVFGGLVSAMDNPESNISNSQTVALPVQQQSLAPINITVINEESTAAKLLAATKIAFLGTGTVGVGACCYKVYKVIDNTDKNVQKIFDIANTGVDDIFKNLKNLLSMLSKEQASELVEDIHKILSGCGNSVTAINSLLSRLNIENFNNMTAATADMINSLKDSIREVLLTSNNDGGRSIISALISLFSQKIQTSKK